LVFAQQTKRVATIAEVNGVVEVKIAKEAWKPAAAGMTLNEGDLIRTRKDSSALLNVDGKAEIATVEVKENTQLKLAQLLEDKEKATQTTLLDLTLGNILIKAKKLHSEKSSFEVKTPTSIVGVRGTTFAVSVETVE
jgi:hypothetical protein